MKLIRRPWIWLLRVRHRKGYGVHSPATFAFLRGVVYERGSYYAYAQLNALHPWWVRWFRLYPLTCRRLLFRLANYVHPARIVLVGDCSTEAAYMAAAVPSAKLERLRKLEQLGRLEHLAPLSPRSPQAAPADLLFLSHSALGSLPAVPIAFPTTLLIVEGIHHDAVAHAAWQRLRDDDRVAHSFDLYTYGLLFIGPPRSPRHYIINF